MDFAHEVVEIAHGSAIWVEGDANWSLSEEAGSAA